ncbi:uncharacterized protein LOC110818315 isoform X2 [Carica papaya]|uniref:uncharacterized protein LOC110818315 isoform X2 n=1 Tax=Carica papaya TaxID=3649 RepID=UPI000B8C962A|nr:uncharacterized protein LOC110818315 isoform X2 [Carica papaya]
MVALSMVPFFGTIRPSPSSLTCFVPYRRPLSIFTYPTSASTNGFSPFKKILQACLSSNPTIGDAVVDLPVEQSEIIFMGTGTSEGIPRVSCLTNPLKKCLVCTKALEPGFSTTVLLDGFLSLGLDDLRDWTNNVQPYIPIYVSKRDFEV